MTLRDVPFAAPALTVYSLDGRPRARRLAVSQDTGGLTFTLPQLALYAAVEVASGQPGA